MKKRHFLPLALAAAFHASGFPASILLAQQASAPADAKAEFLRLQQFDRTGIEPEARKPIEVTESERNPFGRVSAAEEQGVPAGPVTLTDEQKLKRVLSKMQVGGIAGSPGSYRLLLGPLTLGEGDTLPAMFEGQGETVRIESITDRKATFVFVERDNTPPRRFEVSIDLQPKVRSLLVGDSFLQLVPFDKDGEVALGPLQSAAVKSVTENSKAPPAELQSLVDRATELLGDAQPRNKDNEVSAPRAE